jgi:hydrogenase maturation protease
LQPPAPVLVVGYGNPLRGDDALGHIVAETLARSVSPQMARIVTRHSLTPELAAEMAVVRRAVLIDAAAVGPPGRIVCRRVLPGAAGETALAHACDIPSLLAWSQRLWGHAPETFLLAVPGACFALRDRQLSPTVLALVPALVRQARQLIADVGGDGRHEARTRPGT